MEIKKLRYSPRIEAMLLRYGTKEQIENYEKERNLELKNENEYSRQEYFLRYNKRIIELQLEQLSKNELKSKEAFDVTKDILNTLVQRIIK